MNTVQRESPHPPVSRVKKLQAKKIRQQVADKKNVGEQGQCARVLVVSS